MKVNVRFGPVTVVVPCGDGDLSIRQLIAESIVRYKKAASKVRNGFQIFDFGYSVRVRA
jgi:partitioning defective protein 3